MIYWPNTRQQRQLYLRNDDASENTSSNITMKFNLTFWSFQLIPFPSLCGMTVHWSLCFFLFESFVYSYVYNRSSSQYKLPMLLPLYYFILMDTRIEWTPPSLLFEEKDTVFISPYFGYFHNNNFWQILRTYRISSFSLLLNQTPVDFLLQIFQFNLSQYSCTRT